MRVSGIYAGLPFKAQVESTNPLINGNWQYLQDPSVQNSQTTAPQKESHWFRNTVITLAVLGLAAWGLVKGKNSEKVQNILAQSADTFKGKVCKGIDTVGGWVESGWSRLKGLFSKKS